MADHYQELSDISRDTKCLMKSLQDSGVISQNIKPVTLDPAYSRDVGQFIEMLGDNLIKGSVEFKALQFIDNATGATIIANSARAKKPSASPSEPPRDYDQSQVSVVSDAGGELKSFKVNLVYDKLHAAAAGTEKKLSLDIQEFNNLKLVSRQTADSIIMANSKPTITGAPSETASRAFTNVWLDCATKM